MSEPKQKARRVVAVAPGLLHWTVHDDRIDARSDAYALSTGPRSGTIVVDPLPLEEQAMFALGVVDAVVLTVQSHQRSAWVLASAFGVNVHAPRGAQGLELKPDASYDDGALLPGNLRAYHAPGPCDASFALLVDHRAAGRILFVGDLLGRGDAGPLGFAPSRTMDDPGLARESVRRLIDLAPDVVCPGHGAPVLSDGAAALREALERDSGP